MICNDVGEIRFIREDGSVCRVARLASSIFPGGHVHELHWDYIGIVDRTRIAKIRSSVAFLPLLW